MIRRRSQLYLAHERQQDDLPAQSFETEDSAVADLTPEDAAEYIAALLTSLRAIAARAQFRLLSDLLCVAEEEAKLHFRA